MITDLIFKFALWLYTKKHSKNEGQYFIGYRIIPDYESEDTNIDIDDI